MPVRALGWARTAVALAVGAVLVFGLGATPITAAGASVNGTVGSGEGVRVLLQEGASPVIGNTQQVSVRVGHRSVVAYCVAFGRGLRTADPYQETTWVSSDVRNLGAIQWIVAHGYPTVSGDVLLMAAGGARPAGLSAIELDTLAYAGTQAAIWHRSDGTVLRPYAAATPDERAQIPPADRYAVIESIYRYLSKNATDVAEPAPTLKINPSTASGRAGALIGPYTVVSGGGDATVAATGGSVVDRDGRPITTAKSGGQFYVTSGAAGTVTIKATGSGTVPAGRIFVSRDAEHKVILAGAAGATLTATATATFTAKPTLPITGVPVTIAILVGALLLGAGGLTLMLIRRRRIRFIA